MTKLTFWAIYIGLLIAIPMVAFYLSGNAMDYMEEPKEILQRHKVQVGITYTAAVIWAIISAFTCFDGFGLGNSNYEIWTKQDESK
jgi:ABC-type transporter Mla maintaining outer membrane lipid asymmetry permease subunit MlaE